MAAFLLKFSFQFIHQIEVAATVQVGNAFLQQLEGDGVVEHIHRLGKRDTGLFCKGIDDAGVFQLLDDSYCVHGVCCVYNVMDSVKWRYLSISD